MARTHALPALTAAVLLTLTGCSATTEVAHDAGTATASTGETLRVDFGWINTSVGDNWYLVEEPDPEVLREIGKEISDDHPDCDRGDVGCDVGLVWEFEVVGAGTADLVFQYCFRTGLDDCQNGGGEPAPEPVTLTVEVTG